MLIHFLVGNYRSIRDPQSLSLVASQDKSLSSHLIKTGRVVGGSSLKLLRSAIIYGPNASGKSNLCTAITTFRDLVRPSATALKEGDPLPGVDPFRLDVATQYAPTTFEVTVLLEENIYRYGCEVTANEVVREWLYRRKTIPKAPEIMLFDREGDSPAKWKFGPAMRGDEEVLRTDPRRNCLLLSSAGLKKLDVVMPLYRWFRYKILAVDMAKSSQDFYKLVELERADRMLDQDSIREIVQVADSSIADAELMYGLRDPSLEERARFAELGVTENIKNLHSGVVLTRTVRDSRLAAEMKLDDESNGTQRYFALAALIIAAFRRGMTVVIDEMAASLHPMLVREILEVINDPELGTKGSQFIVATHDTDLLDVSRLRRDQVFLLEKGADGASELYSLWDVEPKPRPDASLENQYLAGRFGAVPNLGNLRLAIRNALKRAEAKGAKSKSA